MNPVGFEPTISEGERPQTYALDRAAVGIGFLRQILVLNPPLKPRSPKWSLYYEIMNQTLL